MERRNREEVVMRKGPWMAEEDEILMNYVKKYGPRDWSSIRSKGLLPRTGKSCRLRWVNKLKPNLKTGCKFSAEEERIVIELQARFGNKWARIATYLQGRTDNDVKNFWSTRQKRLARILQTPSPTPKSSHKNKPPVFHHLSPLEGPKVNPISMEEEREESSSMNQYSQSSSSYMGNQEVIKMIALPDLVKPNMEQAVLQENQFPHESQTKQLSDPNPLQYSFPQIPELDLPFLSENHQLDDSDVFGHTMISETQNHSGFSVELPFFGLENVDDNNNIKVECKNPATPDSFFDDFPTDMFDYIEPLPTLSEW